MSEQYCERCAPAAYGLGQMLPQHGGETTRKPGHCYCGKPLRPGYPGYYGEINFSSPPISTEEHARTAVQNVMELQRWRQAAASIALFPGPFNTPEEWRSKQVDALIALVDKARGYKHDAAEARDYVRRLVAPEGMHCWPDVVAEAKKKLGDTPRCCFCGKPGSGDDPLVDYRPLVPGQDYGGCGQTHESCQAKDRRNTFDKMSPGVKERFLTYV